ncbi:putative NADP(+)-dependent dehydrogenase [Aureobasidium sp. EXF-10727]|nr:putative NADP(+)-dependent dehydrogenase [Aureobasidium sp. EXF-10727]
MPYTVFISGANKGLGLGLLKSYLNRADTTVIATVRDPSSAAAKTLNDITKASGTNLHIVKVEARSDTDCLSAITSIKDQGLTHLDLVIANSGFYDPPAEPQVAHITGQALLDILDVNAMGWVRLFQATLPLLQNADKGVFVYMSSAAGSIAATGDMPFPVGIYGASKAAANFLVRRAHQEHPELTIFALHPGAVKTPGALQVIESMGMTDASDFFIDLETSINGMVKVLDNATKEETSGKFLAFDGSVVPW